MTDPRQPKHVLQDKAGAPRAQGGSKPHTRHRGGQVLAGIEHGGHNKENKAAPKPEQFETSFDYLFAELTTDPAAHLPAGDAAQRSAVVAGLKALGDAMVEDSLAPGDDPLQPTGNSIIPAVYTYWGQFIDHDLTANTDRDSEISNITQPDLAPLAPAFVVENLKNLRQPALNLDSVYGDGPTVDAAHPTQARAMYDGIKLRVGKVARNPDPLPDPANPPIRGVAIPPADDDLRDLPRIGTLIAEGVVAEEDFPEALRNKPNFRQTALIADARNDENLIIAQFHTAVLRFHNAVVDWLAANEPYDRYGCKRSKAQTFERARRLTRWHYQWLVINDFLKTITQAGIADKTLLGGPKHYAPRAGEAYMPLEFSVAAYRFGHTMVRGAYDHNRNFGRPGEVRPNASFNLLFAFTGNGSFFGATDVLPFNWIIEWDRFVDKGSSVPDHFARKIDTRLAPPLRNMTNEGNDPALAPDIKDILKRLARRNLLRGYHLSIPTGQSVAAAMGVEPLSADELRMGNGDAMNQVLQDNGFIERTPLWYYVLKEAEVRASGNSLGELGSRIVCETIVGQMLNDPESYLNTQGGWDPGQGVKLQLPNGDGDPIVTIRDFFRFAGLVA